MACSFPPLPVCAPWNQSAACFTSWSSSTDLLHRTSGFKPRLAQYALSIPLLSYSFPLIKKDKGTLWYLSETGDAADPCSAQYSPVLPLSVTAANSFSKFPPRCPAHLAKEAFLLQTSSPHRRNLILTLRGSPVQVS